MIQDYLDAIHADERTDQDFLHLTSNEPATSITSRTFANSPLADRYFMGAGKDGMVIAPWDFTTMGLPGVAKLIEAGETAAREMLRAEVVTLNCLSGVHAMMCAILSTTVPGDTVMTVHHDHGGHFATESILARVGRKHVTTSYDTEKLAFDAEAIAKTFRESGAKAFYMDVSYYLNPHNLREIRDALGEDAIIIYDASHTMGLIMGGEFQKPFEEGADVICANTHKTLPGPQKGMIAFRDAALGQKANEIIESGLYSSPHTAGMISLSITLLEMQAFGQDYAKQVIANSNALGEALEHLGHRLRKANTGRYSETHQIHLLTSHIGTFDELYPHFYVNHINASFDNPDIFNQGAFIRIGTQEITRRGMKEEDMRTIASFIDRSLKREVFVDEVRGFIERFRSVDYSFDA